MPRKRLARSMVREIHRCFYTGLLPGLPEEKWFGTRVLLYKLSPELIYEVSNLISGIFRREAHRVQRFTFDYRRRRFSSPGIVEDTIKAIMVRFDVTEIMAQGLFWWCAEVVQFRPLFFDGLLAEPAVPNLIRFSWNTPSGMTLYDRWKATVDQVQAFYESIKSKN